MFASGKSDHELGSAISIVQFTEGTSPVDPKREGDSHSAVELDAISTIFWAIDCWRSQFRSQPESLIYAYKK